MSGFSIFASSSFICSSLVSSITIHLPSNLCLSFSILETPITFPPLSFSLFAIALPIPLVAPVTNIVFPVKFDGKKNQGLGRHTITHFYNWEGRND